MASISAGREAIFCSRMSAAAASVEYEVGLIMAPLRLSMRNSAIMHTICQVLLLLQAKYLLALDGSLLQAGTVQPRRIEERSTEVILARLLRASRLSRCREKT